MAFDVDVKVRPGQLLLHLESEVLVHEDDARGDLPHVERRLRGLKLDEREALFDRIDPGCCSGSSFRVDVVVVLPGMLEVAFSSFFLIATLQSMMGLGVTFEIEEEAQL